MKITKTYIEVGDDALLLAARSLHDQGELTDDELLLVEQRAKQKILDGTFEETDGYQIEVDTDKLSD